MTLTVLGIVLCRLCFCSSPVVSLPFGNIIVIFLLKILWFFLLFISFPSFSLTGYWNHLVEVPATSLVQSQQLPRHVPTVREPAGQQTLVSSIRLHRTAPWKMLSGPPVMVMIRSTVYLGTTLLPQPSAKKAQVPASGSIPMITYLGTPGDPPSPAPPLSQAKPMSTFLETKQQLRGNGPLLLVDTLAKEGVCSCLFTHAHCWPVQRLKESQFWVILFHSFWMKKVHGSFFFLVNSFKQSLLSHVLTEVHIV